MVTTFIGVDLAWKSDKNNSGIAALRGNRHGATLSSYSRNTVATDSVVDFVLANTTSNTVVAIDAPLIIRNEEGQRPCENLISKRFGRYDASAHTSNLTHCPNAGGVQVAERLVQAGFSHTPSPSSDKLKGGRWFFEVYPHPAQVVLFNLERIIKYKKGLVADRRTGLERLRCHIQTKLVPGKPPIRRNERFDELIERDLDTLKGKTLKYYEDDLDALVCAYLALFYWAWGADKNEMIGDLKTGYIINPTAASCDSP